ncbi:MAG: BtpA/SgcQ family protein [Synergistaceae bacterium]|jgi:membrane complex biogenesis BtpA family protein|nr:BtpA/SgcQ family protein [Synergistaceae bacterium]
MPVFDVMKIKKPIIALLHLRALPGDPLWRPGDSMKDVVKQAASDLDNLQRGDVDAILFSNEFSLPYKNRTDHVTSAAMARVIGEIKADISKPYGVDLLLDPFNIVDLAAAVDASFVREQFTGAFVGEGGIIETDIASTLRRKAALGLHDLKMFYFLNAEADAYLNDRDFKAIARSIIFKCVPDGICVSGSQAGSAPDIGIIEDVKTVTGDTPVLCNTGCNAQNVRQMLSAADGAFVGTAFKTDGRFENFTDFNRVREFMDIVNDFRR